MKIEANDGLDRRTVALGAAVYNLRQDIDLHRIIGLNAREIQDKDLSEALFGHIQRLAHTSIAITICKVFEFQSRNPLCSISALIAGLPQDRESDVDLQRIAAYAETYGGNSACTSPIETISSTFQAFRTSHDESLQRLRLFRDKHAVHLEDAPRPDTLPSHDKFEAMWKYANATYQIIHDEFNDVGPAMMAKTVSVGLVRTLSLLGLENPKETFSGP